MTLLPGSASAAGQTVQTSSVDCRIIVIILCLITRTRTHTCPLLVHSRSRILGSPGQWKSDEGLNNNNNVGLIS